MVRKARRTWRALVPPVIALFVSVILAVLAVGALEVIDPELGEPGFVLVFPVAALMIAPPAILIGMFWRLFFYLTSEATITSRRVIVTHRGLIIRRTLALDYAQVGGLEVIQGVVGRVFNYGTIVFTEAGGKRMAAPFIAQPMEFRGRAMEVIGIEE